ncbi:MAG: hypothetical protein A2Y77_05665 [Planctomycetes bacterium RBG_13_62_9]|nr:MAG: hypothetical protein A2Y77_05665 [Planctomycetes bacterium RBG_13_62_9]
MVGVFLMAAAGAVLPVDPAAGAITATGDITPTYDGFSIPWNISGDLTVGNTAVADLIVSNGSRVTDVNAYIGYTAAGNASVLITGTNSQWINSGDLFIGGTDTAAGGIGILTVSSGGLVEADNIILWTTGSLAGNGTVRADSLTNYGSISPGGGSIGTLTVEGDVTFWVNSALEVQVDNSGHSDMLHVVGDVNIVGGTVRAISTETIVGDKEYTILDGTTVTGQFDALDTALLDVTMVDPNEELGYANDSVVMRITAMPFDLGIGETVNQQALGVALQEIAEEGPSPITSLLQQLPTLDGVRASYDQLAGQNRPPLAPIAAADSAKFMGIISNRLQGARGMVNSLERLSDTPLLAMASSGGIQMPSIHDSSWDGFLWSLGRDTPLMGKQEWGAWAKLYGVGGDRDTDAGIPGYSYSFFGQSFGIDYQFSEDFIGGVTGGRSDGDVDYDGLPDTADIGAAHAGLYSTYSGYGWYLNSIVVYSLLNLETRRLVDLTAEEYAASFDGRELSGYVEAGFDWQPAPTWLIQPLAALQFSFLHLDQYAEDGYAGALVFEDQQYESYKVAVGAKLTKELLLDAQGHTAIVQGRARWIHDFGDVLSTVDARFEDVPPISWEVSDAELSRDSIMVGAGVGVRLARGLRAFVDYDTSFNSDASVSVISGAVEYRW